MLPKISCLKSLFQSIALVLLVWMEIMMQYIVTPVTNGVISFSR